MTALVFTIGLLAAFYAGSLHGAARTRQSTRSLVELLRDEEDRS